jgi:hypothetical protein
MPRVRLVKLLVQPTFVVDDGETLVEQVADAIPVTAAEWPTFAADRFVAMVDELQRRVDAQSAIPAATAADPENTEGGNIQ